ncbi:MAG: GAP family protein [Solirubrobacteraceae bacterium]
MLSLAVAVIAIALPDSINPSLIAAELVFAAGTHASRRTVAFTAVAFGVTFLAGLALALGLGDLILSVVPKPGRTVKYALITAAGIVLVLGGAVVWLRRRSLASPDTEHRRRPVEPGSPVLVGAGITALELLTAFPYFAAIGLIVGSSTSDSGKIFLLALYCVVYTAPLIAIAVVCAVMGTRAEAVLAPVMAWLLTRWPLLVAPLAAVLGIGLAAYGIAQLSSA